MADLDSFVIVEDLYLPLVMSYPFSCVRIFPLAKMHVPCLETGPCSVAIVLSL